MPRRVILFSIELGAGFGHLKRNLPIAEAAARAGYRPIFLVTNPEELKPVLGESSVEVQASPFVSWLKRCRRDGVATSYADIIGSAGFADREILQEVTARWDALFAELRPGAVVAELSPFLNLAAHDSGLPVLVVGHGFALPPPHLAVFPKLWDGEPLYQEADLLENVGAVLRGRGRSVLPTLPSLLEGNAHAVTGLEVLDPYKEQRRQPTVGPPGFETRRAMSDPEHEVFGYLTAEARVTVPLLRALVTAGVRGRVYVRGGSALHRNILVSSRVRYLDRPLAMQHALESARLIVHHGSMLTAEEALAAGRPQLVAPLYLEHLFTARSLAALSVARVARSSSEPDLLALLRSSLDDEGMAKGALRYSEHFWRTAAPPRDLPERLLALVSAAGPAH